MFIDKVQIKVIAGKGGDGAITWRREKYIPKGGPRGGNGGNGGNVFIQTTSNLNTLSEYRHKKLLKAESGEKGGTNLMAGACGKDLVLFVPIGTIVKDTDTGEIIVDLDKNNTKYLLAKGGRGGFGNAHFATSTRQTPKFAELGDIPEKKEITLELKLVADIGIIGIPSAGKSTLIGNITNVKPKIGDYPFTTLVPNLGILEHKGKNLILEDVPGLIKGASEGKGLGIDFLSHIERTKILLHLLDLNRLDKVFEDYRDIRNELESFGDNLSKKQEIIALSKADLLDNEMKEFIKKNFEKKFKKKNIFIISAATGEGVESLKDYLIKNFSSSVLKNDEVKLINEEKLKVIDLTTIEDPKSINIKYVGDYAFRASGERLEQIVRMTDFENIEAVARVYDVLNKIGIIKKIEKKLKIVLEEENIDNSFFFEGGDESNFSPRVIVGEREIPLDRLKYNF